MIYSIHTILSHIRYKPNHLEWIKEPKESCGMTVVIFRSFHGIHGNLEYYEDRSIYFELINLTKYKDGDIINEDRRNIIINNLKILDANHIRQYTDIINDALNKLYKGEFNLWTLKF